MLTFFASVLASLPDQPPPTIRLSRLEKYTPYLLADVRTASQQRKFTFGSAFSGGGGSSVGYCLAGGVGLFAIDFVPEAARTYRRNFPRTLIDRRDIREITRDARTVAELLERVNLKPGDLDILDGSPPCCEFSTAGRGIGDQEVMRVYSDVVQNNIASLAFDHADLIQLARPKVFVVENVPAFASARSREVYERLLHALRYLADGTRSYYVNAAVLSADDFGVPQNRKRLFIVGVRKDVGEAVGFGSDDAVRDAIPAPTKVGATVRSALAGLHQTENDVWPWFESALTTQLSGLIRRLPKCPPERTRFPDVASAYTLTRSLHS